MSLAARVAARILADPRSTRAAKTIAASVLVSGPRLSSLPLPVEYAKATATYALVQKDPRKTSAPVASKPRKRRGTPS